MEITKITGGALPTNCYLLQDVPGGAAAVVDPGFWNTELERAVKAAGVDRVELILLTHGHHDHIEGLPELKKLTNARVVIYEGEEAFLSNSALSLSSMLCPGSPKNPSADTLVKDGDTLRLGGLSISVLHTPGHTAGSCCYKAGDALFTGDTLFQCSAGRTDLPTGDYAALISSLRRLKGLEGNLRVLPGHEGTSTLDFERENNPYME